MPQIPASFVVYGLVGITLGALLHVLIRFTLSTLRPPNFPPGPPTVPGLGNLHQLPRTANFLTFTTWARQYGPILGLKAGPNNLVIIHKAAHVRALWVQRGALYAARPRTAIVCEYVLPEDHFRQVAFMSPEYHKVQRAATRQHLGPVGFERMKPFQQAFGARLMFDLLEKPEDFREAIMRWGMGTPLYMILGRRLEDMPKDWAAKYSATQHGWVQLLDPSTTPPVDIFPFLAWLPEKLATWKHHAKVARQGLFEAYSGLVDHAHQAADKGADAAHREGPVYESLVEKLVRENGEPGSADAKAPSLSRTDMAFIAGGVLDGAFDTAFHTSLTMLKTLAAYPDVQKRLQEELDDVWGHDTGIPGTIDLDKLPYLHSFLLEVLRWRPTTPLSVARRVTAAHDFQGHHIPADTTAMINVWAIQHDPELYDHPDDFNPARFMGNPLGTRLTTASHAATSGDPDHDDDAAGLLEEEKDARMPLYVFGAGRRACPGEHFAMNALKLAFAQLARSFDVVADEEMDMSVETGFVASFVLMPKPYRVRIVPRGEKADLLIRCHVQKANGFLERAME